MAGELGRLNDPNYAIQLAVGPPFPDLVPQRPGTGLILANRCETVPRRFIFKKAHMSREDFRIFNAQTHQVAAVLHHFGKNPYDSLDPLGISNFASAQNNRLGEWESLCTVSGYNGMPSLKIRPKALTRHGRQYVYDFSQRLLFNIGKESKLKNLALRSNLAVCVGDTKEPLYRILPDLMGRTFQIVNPQEQLVCFVQKSTKALIMEATLGAGSEMMIDVAPGADWTAMVAVVMALQQVGEHFVKDALKNYVVNPLTNTAVDTALDATGMQSTANSVGHSMDSAMLFMNKVQRIHKMFTT